MELSMFHSILFTDLSEELNKLNSTKAYNDSTRDFWEQEQQDESSLVAPVPTVVRGEVERKQDDSACTHNDCSLTMETFIICSSLPKKSGYVRKNDLLNILSKAPYDADGDTTVYMGDAIYNAQDLSCFFVSMSFQRAKSLFPTTAATSITASGAQLVLQQQQQEKDTKADAYVIILQPMLPMMKIGLGTVDKAIEFATRTITSSQNVDDGSSTSSSVSIQGQLSPFAKNVKKNNHIQEYMNDIVHEIQNRSNELCQEQMLRALPYTGNIYTCPQLPMTVPIVVDVPKQDADYDVVQLTMDMNEMRKNNNTTSATVTKAILAMITGLASSRYFDFLEVGETPYYYYYNSA
eukprot:CAMPEP_0176486930 /NCGR_PEP_ID=MMETSP0200_2-20121128/5844_1 /TAXON_ID=947934 /ORGANISM="Chaetoceros sp., Strain GSL56" /LENGTH=349 /DNA_ID=CAMNT_0017883691 /DNA_START=313 /DNA_END=1362 /DNA_ORIENTATION=-